MGFTRYWRQPQAIAADAWGRILADARQLLTAVDIPLVGDEDDGGPIVTDERICCNGVDDERCEPFVLRPEGGGMVKTNGYDYDLVVAAVLAIAKHHAPSSINVSNDDDADDAWDCWQPSVALCARAGVTIAPNSIAALRADVGAKARPPAQATKVPSLRALAPPAPADPSRNSVAPIEQRSIPGPRPWEALFVAVHLGDRATASAFVRELVAEVIQRKLGQPPNVGIFVALTGVLSAAELAAAWTAAVSEDLGQLVFMGRAAFVCAFPEEGEPQEPLPLVDPELRDRVRNELASALKKPAKKGKAK